VADPAATALFAVTFADELARAGLRDVCLAPGSRSAPLAMAFARHPALKVWVHVDERCAAFFGLGLSKATERPVALLCTSGTAAAELHPAVIEAHHSGSRLLVLTADRPAELRDVGANQSIDQARLYGGAVRWCFDPGPPEVDPDAPRRWRRLAARAVAATLGPPPGPVHLNLPFREPLVTEPGATPAASPPEAPPLAVVGGAVEPSEDGVASLAEALAAARRPLIVAGEMRDGDRLRCPLDVVLGRLDAPLLAEPLSQLRWRGARGLVEAYDALLRQPSWAARHRPDLVLRLGAPPTSKPLNQHLAGAERTIVVDPGGRWRDPDQLAHAFWRCDPAPLLERVGRRLGGSPGPWARSWREASAATAAAIERRLPLTPLYEAHVARALARALPEVATVFVGSSMPVRDVDTFWPAASPAQRFLGNRGASGIDGLVSTGLGAAAAGSPAVLLLGDLSLYHDMNGLWAIGRHRLVGVTVVVLDNGGGGIFEFLPQARHRDVFEEVFATPLGLRLERVADLYGLDFVGVEEAAQLPGALSAAVAAERPALVCVRFSREASVRGHRACWEAVAEALG
jgi:2-succinyl-5-enolpyruvyl-6-hydroxy-3-cyclohexene-1-carboxylate synthase